MVLFVKSAGSDSPNTPGTKENPLATVGEALNRLAYAFADKDYPWPGKGTDVVNPGTIIILGTVEVTQTIAINNLFDAYPPIVLCDDPETPGGTLRATRAIESGGGDSLLRLDNGAQVTLAGNLTLRGTGKDTEDNICGVYVNGGSVFTMNGGTISGYSGSHGGGVYVRGEFTMNGGEISGNSASQGGGVYVFGGTVTLKGGVISGNSGSSGGGGLTLYIGTVIMEGGKISGNFSEAGGGGGVHMASDATFTLSNGEISGNSASRGGGVQIASDAAFTMTGGEIWGNTARKKTNAGGGGIYVRHNVKFAKTGGIIYGYDEDAPNNPKNNRVVDKSNEIQGSKGHAVVCFHSCGLTIRHFKDTTVGPGDILYYNHPDGNDTGRD